MILKKVYDTSNYEVDRQLPKGMNKKVINLNINNCQNKYLILIFIQLKMKQSITQSGHIFQIIHTEY